MMSKTKCIKLLTLGDSAVGKTALLLQYTQHEFEPEFMTTIGIDFRLKTLTAKDGQSTKIQIWDTAGQERFRTITRNYYRDVSGILMIYDITSQSSFNNVTNWMKDIQTYANSNVKIILIGNKSDLNTRRVITTQQGQALAKTYNIPFIESSAKNNINVEDAFNTLINSINPSNQPSQNLNINSKSLSKHKCC